MPVINNELTNSGAFIYDSGTSLACILGPGNFYKIIKTLNGPYSRKKPWFKPWSTFMERQMLYNLDKHFIGFKNSLSEKTLFKCSINTVYQKSFVYRAIISVFLINSVYHEKQCSSELLSI